jgi:hypothetical protein
MSATAAAAGVAAGGEAGFSVVLHEVRSPEHKRAKAKVADQRGR